MGSGRSPISRSSSHYHQIVLSVPRRLAPVWDGATHGPGDAMISVGYLVKSRIATQFCMWVIERLREYVVKGFMMDNQ